MYDDTEVNRLKRKVSGVGSENIGLRHTEIEKGQNGRAGS